ncbi:hypothetical protein CXG81DRAFT_25007 [Caulochytrium protostelioides]|uniref:Uncharacterized protein n=1 Tax=Caulochytrium protostelioides TaxID=1555241 RepID=A0A4P9XAA8_9FUNG|nr:hypothetical protein CXG81DRAFT_25007 [Caulochytrium protostelioides]|eukprot:RKP02313.1 hypothetical protein CXG81DRAFT_25007 [Caulochytrium protostelioides]
MELLYDDATGALEIADLDYCPLTTPAIVAHSPTLATAAGGRGAAAAAAAATRAAPYALLAARAEVARARAINLLLQSMIVTHLATPEGRYDAKMGSLAAAAAAGPGPGPGAAAARSAASAAPPASRFAPASSPAAAGKRCPVMRFEVPSGVMPIFQRLWARTRGAAAGAAAASSASAAAAAALPAADSAPSPALLPFLRTMGVALACRHAALLDASLSSSSSSSSSPLMASSTASAWAYQAARDDEADASRALAERARGFALTRADRPLLTQPEFEMQAVAAVLLDPVDVAAASTRAAHAAADLTAWMDRVPVPALPVRDYDLQVVEIILRGLPTPPPAPTAAAAAAAALPRDGAVPAAASAGVSPRPDGLGGSGAVARYHRLRRAAERRQRGMETLIQAFEGDRWEACRRMHG